MNQTFTITYRQTFAPSFIPTANVSTLYNGHMKYQPSNDIWIFVIIAISVCICLCCCHYMSTNHTNTVGLSN